MTSYFESLALLADGASPPCLSRGLGQWRDEAAAVLVAEGFDARSDVETINVALDAWTGRLSEEFDLAASIVLTIDHLEAVVTSGVHLNGAQLGLVMSDAAEAGAAVQQLRGLRERAARPSAAKLGAKARADAADKDWRNFALSEARSIRAQRPEIGQDPLADRLREIMLDRTGEAVSQKQIKKSLKLWEMSGRLPRSSGNPALR